MYFRIVVTGFVLLAAAACSSGGGSGPGDVGPLDGLVGDGRVGQDLGTEDGAAEDIRAGDLGKDGTVADGTGTEDGSGDVELVGTDTGDDGLTDADGGPGFVCEATQVVVPSGESFADVSSASGVRAGNYVVNPTKNIPINDHSRLGFADINGDGFDDIVAHTLYPNPQAGIPFDHVVLLNNKDGTFTDFSAESNLKEVQAGFFAFGDVDNDGDVDCFAGVDVELSGANHAVLLNDGGGRFTKVPVSGIEAPGVPLAAGNAVFADFNNDSFLDLYIGLGHTNYAAKDQLFVGNGDGTFEKYSLFLAGNPQRPTNGTVVCDFDNDGDSDIVVSTYGVSTELGANILWQNDGQAKFTNVAVEKGFAALPTGNYFLASTGNGLDEEPGKAPGTYMGSNGFGVDCDDVNNDGNMDIFLSAISHPVDSDYSRKWSDPSQLLINSGSDGGFVFANEFLSRKLPFNEGDIDAALIDFDNDGRMDVSLSRDNKYEPGYTEIDQLSWFGLMRQKGDGTFESLGYTSGINNPESVYTASLTECTTDAECVLPEACLFSRCRLPCSTDEDCLASHETCIWLWNAGLAVFQPFCRPLVEMKKAQNHAWSDVDHDGDLDLLVGGRDIGGGRPNFLFRNDIGDKNRWVAMRLTGDGVHVNMDGIGARVKFVFSDRTIMREVQASRGMYNSMDGLAVHVGLGDQTCDYVMEVRWPDGTTASFASGTFPERSWLSLTYPDVLTWE